MKNILLLSALLIFSLFSQAQFSVTGTVIDAETKEPLQGASVFAQNTTKGTISGKDGNFSLYLDKGGYELNFSFTGYDTKTVSIQGDPHAPLAIELNKADNSMSEVIIKTSNELADGWERYGRFFLDHFIGATPLADSCTLENPEVLKFLYFKRNDRLKVLASEPLQILNRSLGYRLRYELDSFVYFFKSDVNSYRGQCLYTPLEGTEAENLKWKKNRENAYYGSRLHFLRSYQDSALEKEGFLVDLLAEGSDTRFERVKHPYDTAYYYYNDTTADAELWFPTKASISYFRKFPDKRYLQAYKMPLDVRMQISYVTLLDGIVIKPNGYFFDQESWINEGYWSWKNLADQLPYDYEPGD